jgi:hypothetical protein
MKVNTKMKIKMKTMLALAGLLALGATAPIVNAQDNHDGPPDGGPAGHHRHPPLPLITALDANHDHAIDSNEIANASAALKTLDKNGDGQLTADEYLPPLPSDAPKNAPRPPSPLILKALDANSDGVIDSNEIANAPTALKSLDKIGDGQLTPDEFMGKRPAPPADANGGNEAGGPPDGAPSGPPPEQP